MDKKTAAKNYNFEKIEKTVINFWKENPKLENNQLEKKKFFSILMPPPNITGKLHIGHALNNFIQDSLIRFTSLEGKKTVWIPGFDHAGIATEIMVKNWIKTHHWKITTKGELKQYFWKWVTIHQKKIEKQWERLGLTINQKLISFTLDSDFSLAVKKTFVQLYKDKLIYQSKKLVNFDLSLKTVISDIEVTHKEKIGKMYYIKYFSLDYKEYLLVATTRPETIFADQALVVHPDDQRYQNWVKKKMINPLTKSKIPVITSKLINKNLGTGVMKCTPGHDFQDFTINQSYHFPLISCFDQEGKLNDLGQEFKGLDRLDARPLIVKKLTEQKLLTKTETIVHQLPFAIKTDTLIEPMLSQQWFIKTQIWAKNLLQEKEKINFIPNKFNNQFLKWLENCQDWCISRQLNWGHRLPVYFNAQNKILVTANEPDKKIWKQSEEVLDTWFSSGLWSLVNSGWNRNNDKVDFSNFAPFNYLVTSYDIIFFWITRMLFLHYHFQKKIPFQNILIHGLIRTNNHQKMSKSKGNVIGPEEIIAKYGGDSLRLYLLANHKIGEDFFFQEKKIEQAYQFCNKVWNINYFVNLYPDDEQEFAINACQEELNLYIMHKFQVILRDNSINFKKHLWSLVIQQLIDFVWKDFGNFYLILAKKCLKKSHETRKTMHWIWKQVLLILHPYLPFLTQYLWNKNYQKANILNQRLPIITKFKITKWPILEKLLFIKEQLKTLKTSNKTKALKLFTTQPFFWQNNLKKINLFLEAWNSKIVMIENSQLEKITLVKKTLTLEEIWQEIIFWKKEMQRSEKILNNDQFLKKAKANILAKEKRKAIVNKQKLKNLQTLYQEFLLRKNN